MIVVWGKKHQRTPRGSAIRFCPICRDVHACRVLRVAMHHHVYMVSLPGGRPLADEAICDGCSCRFAGQPGTFEGRTAPSEQDQQRQEIETRVPARVSREERSALIVEPLYALEYDFRYRLERGSHESVIAVLVVLFMPILGVFAYFWFEWLGNRPFAPSQDLVIALLSTLALVVVGVPMVWLITTARRRVARQLLPKLLDSLRVLRPTLEEIEHAIADLQKRGLGLARAISPRSLRPATEAKM